MSDKLKRCPFCGGQAAVDRMGTARASMQVSCGDCGASTECGAVSVKHSSWNDRVGSARETEQAARIAELEAGIAELQQEADNARMKAEGY